jgi:hypothetical protein
VSSLERDIAQKILKVNKEKSFFEYYSPIENIGFVLNKNERSKKTLNFELHLKKFDNHGPGPRDRSHHNGLNQT